MGCGCWILTICSEVFKSGILDITLFKKLQTDLVWHIPKKISAQYFERSSGSRSNMDKSFILYHSPMILQTFRGHYVHTYVYMYDIWICLYVVVLVFQMPLTDVILSE